MRDRVVFVRVALRAADRETEENGAGRGRPVDRGLGAIELEIRPGLVVLQRIAVKAGGDLLLERGIREEVARELFDGELIEGLVPVHRIDHPVAVEVRIRPQRVV